MFWRDWIWGRYRLLASKEIVIERHSRLNPIWLFIILCCKLINIPLYIFSVGKFWIKTEEMFVYEYSMKNNLIYHLRNQNNYYAHKIKENHRILTSLEETNKDEVKLLEDYGSRGMPWCSEWRTIPKAEVYRTGRMNKVKADYLNILNKETLKSFQKGRRYADVVEEEVRPVSATSAYVLSHGDKTIDRAFSSMREDMDLDNVMGYRDPDKHEKDSKGGISRKRQKNETEEAHQRRLKAMQSGNFDPNKWNWQEGKPK